VGKIAETFDALMEALGYDEYVAQGGDWGSSVSRMLSVKFPARCRAVHVNLQKGLGPPVWWRNPWVWTKMHSQLVSYTAEEEYLMARTRWFDREETGYRVIPARPAIESSEVDMGVGYSIN
jgi:pimeloyl-ACP methyl ester carboxylesterase